MPPEASPDQGVSAIPVRFHARMRGMSRPGWLTLGAIGFLAGLAVYAAPVSDDLHHLALLVMIAAPVLAFWRLMKPRLAPHCPRPPEPGSPQ